VLSGRGLVNIYNFFADKYPADVSEELILAMETGDAAAAVSSAGLSAPSSLAGRALTLFVEIYGAQAGNYALTCMSTGGVYIAGGIATKIRECFTVEAFLAAFQNKGPMQQLMRTIPVSLVLDAQVGLKGAALVASRLR
jgi:glucokinase